MPSRRLPLFWIALSLALALVATARSRGEAQRASFDVAIGLALPAVDIGVVSGRARLTGTTEAVRRGIRTGSGSDDIRADDGSRVVRGRVVVKFRDGVPTAARASAVSEVLRTASLADRLSNANFDTVRIDAAEDPQSVARALSGRSDVEYAQPAHRVYPQMVPNDPLYKQLQWNLPLINLERAWDIQPQAGSSITVAVIDTGVAYTSATITATLPARRVEGTLYPELGPVTIPYAAAFQLGPSSRFVAPRDFICGATLPALGPLDFDGHGTHVSGTIGQLTNDNVGTAGVAFNVRIMPIKVLASFWDVVLGCAPETGGTDDDVARGVRYAADNGAKIINLSLGGPGPVGSSPVMEDAIKYAVGKGVFVAIAAGNDFEDGNRTQEPAEIAQRVKGAVSVAAVDPNKSHSWFSSSGDWVELSAPGGSDRGFGDGGYVWQQTFDFSRTDTFDPEFGPYRAPRFDVLGYVGYIGTSQATPHVAGVAAMLMQQGITDPAAIEDALETSATHLGASGRNPLYGFGLINARNALFGLGIAK
jgi:serine protease